MLFYVCKIFIFKIEFQLPRITVIVGPSESLCTVYTLELTDSCKEE